MLRLRTIVSLLAAGGLLAATAGATADQYRRRRPPHYTSVVVARSGVYVGAGVAGTGILHQDGGAELLDHGGGLTLYTGLRINRTLAIELGWAGTVHDPEQVTAPFGDDVDYLVLNALTADAKLFFASDARRFEPYAQGGVGAYFLDSDYFGTQSIGSGFQLGGGFDVAVGRGVALGLRALYRGIAMRAPDDTVDGTFVGAVTVEGNVTLRF